MLSLLIFKAEVIGMENLKAVTQGAHNLTSGSLQRLKKMGSDHISFSYIKKSLGLGSVAVGHEYREES